MKKFLLGLSLVIFSLHSNSQLVAKTLTASNGKLIGFYDFKPADYNSNPTKKYPLIIFLHGIGERGNGTSELYMLTWLAIPKLLAYGGTMTFTNPKTGQKESFLVLCPQLDRAYGYWDNFYVDEMLKYAQQNLRYDPNRVYLTGLSSGGGGTWRYPTTSLENAQKFAAIAPVCGTCEWNSNNFCSTIASAKTAVYGFHAVDDGIASIYCLNAAVGAINACSPGLATTTIYNYGNHYIWDYAYDTTHSSQNPNMFEWFLTQSRSGASSTTPTNVQPVARAGDDITITQPASSATLNGGSSYDPDGSITGYSWALISGPPSWASITSPTSSSTQLQNLAAGTYVFRLTVTDNNWGSSTDDVNVTINAATPTPGQLPTASAGADQTINYPTTLAYVDGTQSSSPGATISKYSWSKISGPSQFSISFPDRNGTYITGLVSGAYTFRLTVTDSRGGTATDDVVITVNGGEVAPAPVPPVTTGTASVNAGSDQTINYPTTLAYVEGTATPSSGATVSKYAWSKVSGPSEYSISFGDRSGTYMTNLVGGTYTFRLTMTDSKGVVASDDVVITVNGNTVVQPAPTPPSSTGASVNAGKDQTINYPTNLAYIEATATPSSGATASKYVWSKVAGPSQYTISFSDRLGTYMTNLVSGNYTFRLTMTDSKGVEAYDDVVITVNGDPAATQPVTPPVTSNITVNAGNDVKISLPTTLAYVEGSSTPSSGATITKYSWTKIAGPGQFTISFPNFNGTYLTGLTQGTYTFRLTVTDSKGATASDDVNVTVAPVGATIAGSENDLNAIDIVSNQLGNKVSIYPNPVDGSLNFKWTSDFRGTAKMNIINVSGQIIKSWQIKKDQQEYNRIVDVTSLKPGVSIIQILTQDGKNIKKKFLKN